MTISREPFVQHHITLLQFQFDFVLNPRPLRHRQNLPVFLPPRRRELPPLPLSLSLTSTTTCSKKTRAKLARGSANQRRRHPVFFSFFLARQIQNSTFLFSLARANMQYNQAEAGGGAGVDKKKKVSERKKVSENNRTPPRRDET